MAEPTPPPPNPDATGREVPDGALVLYLDFANIGEPQCRCLGPWQVKNPHAGRCWIEGPLAGGYAFTGFMTATNRLLVAPDNVLDEVALLFQDLARRA